MGRFYARARHYEPGKMNKTEAEYSQYLEILRLGGEIHLWVYEPIKLRLADRTYYSPDFLVITMDREIEIHEVKGHWEDDARVKIKVAAEQFPYFKFTAVKKQAKKRGGGWEFEHF